MKSLLSFLKTLTITKSFRSLTQKTIMCLVRCKGLSDCDFILAYNLFKYTQRPTKLRRLQYIFITTCNSVPILFRATLTNLRGTVLL